MPRAVAIALSAGVLAACATTRVCLAAGASVPFTTYEAEAGATNSPSMKIVMSTPPTSTTSTPEYEASGRGYVALTQTGHYVEFANVRAANKMTIRHCIPDSSGGGGATATLALYVKPSGSSTWTFRQNITLSSKYNWLYGNAGENGQSNTPSSGTPHAFWDDFRFSISGAALQQGDSIRLQKDAGNTAAFYRIDLIDLETSPSALPTPAAGTYIDITAPPYNAVPNDGVSDSAAIQAAVTAAGQANPKKIVWIPNGVFNLSSQITVNGVTVRGRGHWHSRLVLTNGGVRAFKLTGNGAKIADFALFNESTATNRSSTTYGIEAAFGATTNWTAENLWVQHTGAGFWISGANGGTIRNCRVYNTYADGINLNRGSSNNLLEHNYVRGCGDDSLASISEVQNGGNPNPIATNNTLRFNTAIANWWGCNMVLRGGGGHVIEDNYLADSTSNPGLGINIESAYPMYPITSATFRRNVLARCGGNKAGQKRGAIFFYASAAPIEGVAFHDTTITKPIFRGVHFHNGGQNLAVTFNNTTISNPGEDGVVVPTGSKPVGTASFVNGSITGLQSGFVKFKYNAGSTPNFVLTHSGF